MPITVLRKVNQSHVAFYGMSPKEEELQHEGSDNGKYISFFSYTDNIHVLQRSPWQVIWPLVTLLAFRHKAISESCVIIVTRPYYKNLFAQIHNAKC